MQCVEIFWWKFIFKKPYNLVSTDKNILQYLKNLGTFSPFLLREPLSNIIPKSLVNLQFLKLQIKADINPNLDDVWKALPGTREGSWSPPIYLSCLWSDFQNSFFWWKLLKIVIFLLHRQPPIFHRLAARCCRSDEGQSWQHF